jgi:glycosyltransferase involved in cell wall biosynthesis
MWIAVHQSNESYGSDRSFASVVAAMHSRFGDGILVGPRDGLKPPPDGRVSWPLPKVYRKMFTVAGLYTLCVQAVQVFARLVRQRLAGRKIIAVNTLALAPVVLLARILGMRPVVFIREIIDDRPLLGRVLLMMAVLPASLVICNSHATRAWVVSLFGARRWIRVVHNGVPAPVPCRTALLADARVVFVGRLSANKGVDLAIEALARLRMDHPYLRLVVVGGPAPGGAEYEEVLRHRTRVLGVEDRVDFLGYRRDAASLFAGALVALVPSRFSEPFGRTAVEAMLCGAPVVAARVGGLPEIVEDGVSGLLFARDSVEDLVAKVQVLLDDERLRDFVAANGRRRAAARFSESAMCRRACRLINRVLSK